MDDSEKEFDDLERLLGDVNAEPIPLSYACLRKITANFSQEIGHGGFGVVYMGNLQNGKVVVKKLNKVDDFSEKQFEDELLCLLRVKHKNIVRFLGYCSDTSKQAVLHNGKYVLAEVRQRFLCFDYVPNKSLKDYLKDESYGCQWDTTYQLIEGICHGLCYLHKEEHIIHLDLKPENVLLDANMVPKITDFGLSRRFGEQSRIITEHIRGTPGYIAPEYLDNGEISFKTDIFSLGIMIIELLRASNDLFDLKNWDKLLVTDKAQVQRCVKIAQLCVDADQCKRPTIEEIVCMLNEKETVIEMVIPIVGLSGIHPGLSLEQVSSKSTRLLGMDHGRIHTNSGAKAMEPRQVDSEAAKETAENCFGEVVDDHKLDELVKHAGKTKTQEDRARLAWRLMDEDDKMGKASRYADFLKAQYASHDQPVLLRLAQYPNAPQATTLCLLYNATGDTLCLVANHDWHGHISRRVDYPAKIGNGQWAAFHHVPGTFVALGSVGAVVYRGKRRDGQGDRDYLLAWRTPGYFPNKAYGEIGAVDYFVQRGWNKIYKKLENGDYSSNNKSDGCEIQARIDIGINPKFIATIKTEHGP